MTNWIYEEAKDTARKVRKALKKAFPELDAKHFSVTSSTYSMGSSVSVRWTDYPTEEEVSKITEKYCSKGSVDMTDYAETTGYIDPEDGQRYNGADYVMLSYQLSSRRKNVLNFMSHAVFENHAPNTIDGDRNIRVLNKDVTTDFDLTGDFSGVWQRFRQTHTFDIEEVAEGTLKYEDVVNGSSNESDFTDVELTGLAKNVLNEALDTKIAVVKNGRPYRHIPELAEFLKEFLDANHYVKQSVKVILLNRKNPAKYLMGEFKRTGNVKAYDFTSEETSVINVAIKEAIQVVEAESDGHRFSPLMSSAVKETLNLKALLSMKEEQIAKDVCIEKIKDFTFKHALVVCRADVEEEKLRKTGKTVELRIFHLLDELQGTYTPQDKEITEKLSKYVHALVRQCKERYGKDNYDITIDAKNFLIKAQIGSDLFYIHPRFIVNYTSHKVYVDKTEALKLGRPSDSIWDKRLGRVFSEKLAVIVSERRKRDITRVDLSENDLRRLHRLNTLLENKLFKGKKLPKERFTAGHRTVNVKLGGYALALSPTYIMDIRSGRLVYERDANTSALKDVEEKLPLALSRLSKVQDKDLLFYLYAVYMEATDLRKQVTDNRGLAV